MTTEAQTAPMTRRELEAKIVARAWEDEDFRRRFLANPKAMFEEYLGTKLPENLVMTAHEEDTNSLHFVIPAKPTVDLEELSDEDLERVAGGVEIVTTVVVGTAISMGTAASVAVTVSASVAMSAAGASVWGRNT